MTEPTQNVLACPPVDPSFQRALGLVDYKPTPGAIEKPCKICHTAVHVGKQQGSTSGNAPGYSDRLFPLLSDRSNSGGQSQPGQTSRRHGRGVSCSELMVRIVQMLCPERHCLMAVAYESEASTFEAACESLKEITGPKGPFTNQCALCGSKDIHFEEGATKFKTLQDTAPFLGAAVAANAQTRAMLERLGMTHEKRQKN